MGEKILYHYTTMSSFDSMLKSNEIWLGNVKYMNDGKETDYFFDILKSTLKTKYSVDVDDLIDNRIRLYKDEAKYAFCLSKNKDDAAQWSRYAQEGHGLCLVFDSDKIDDSFLRGRAIKLEVYYEEDLNDHRISELLNDYMSAGTANDIVKELNDLLDNAWAWSTAYKQPSFRAENEVRICSYPFRKAKQLRYIVTKKGLREFYPLAVCFDDLFCGNVVQSIMFGPHFDVEVDMFRRYLSSNGIDGSSVHIAKSTCPLQS